jgi:hypothetical protein
MRITEELFQGKLAATAESDAHIFCNINQGGKYN